MGPLTLLPLLGLTLRVQRASHCSFAVAFFFSTAFVILTLYAGALVGALWWTALIVHFAGIALLGIGALELARRRAADFVIPVPLAVLGLLCAWFWIVHGADEYFLYDEYSHWGIFAKEMLTLDGFWRGDTNAMHPRYPPGASLWHYLFNAFMPLSEGRVYFAHFVLLLAPLLILWDKVRWSQPMWAVAILALVLLSIANFGLGVSTLYVDQIIGVWYLGTLLAAISDDKLASRRLIAYAAPIAVIALLKDVGVAFAGAAAGILAMLVCLQALTKGGARSSFPRTAAAFAILLAPALLCVQVWAWNRDAAGAGHEVQSVGGIIGGVVSETVAAKSEIAKETERRLAEVFFDQQLSNTYVTWDFNEFSYGIRALFTDSYRLTTFGLLLGFVIWWALVGYSLLRGDSRRQWLLVATGVLVTAVGYIALLHLSYRFAFGERGLELPSYVRYVHVVALPMLLLSFSPLLPAFRETDRTWRTKRWAVPQRTALFVTGVLALYALETPYLRPILQANPKIAIRKDLEPLFERLRSAIGTSRIWIYLPVDSPNGLIGRLFQYLLTPTPASVERSQHFWEGSDHGAIRATWREFDYVWIPSPLSADAAAGLARFAPAKTTAGLFRVNRPTASAPTLEPMALPE